MKKEEILKRMAELKAELEDDSKEVNLEEIEKEINELETQLKELEQKPEGDEGQKVPNAKPEGEPEGQPAEPTKPAGEPQPEENKEEEEKKKRKAIAEKLNQRKLSSKDITPKPMEERDMEKFTIASPEYRTAWAKKLMGLNLDDTEKRALGDAITTTATTFVEADADTQGINNAGLLIPESVRKELLENIYRKSPFLRDVRKLQVKGNVDLPYLFEADDASWGVSETTCTSNEGQEYKRVQLTGWELVKNVVVSWKAEAMTIDGFIAFIIDELTEKCARALAHAVIYGDGDGKPTGAIYNIDAVTGSDPIKLIADTKNTITSDLRIDAKVYISETVSDAIVFKKDANGNYPFVAGMPKISNLTVEVDPFLESGDILVGNPRYYILNENSPLRIDKEVSVKCRKTTYGGYAIYDGKARPGAFAKGTLVSASI